MNKMLEDKEREGEREGVWNNREILERRREKRM